MAYAEVEDLKAYLRIPPANTDDDDRAASILEAVSNEIDHVCSRTFTPTVGGPPEDRTRHYAAPYWHKRMREWRVDIPDYSNGGDLEVMAYSVADTDWTTPVTLSNSAMRPLNGAPLPKPWTSVALAGSTWPSAGYCGSDESVNNLLLVLLTPGWIATPAKVFEATLLQSSRLLRRRDAIFGIVASPDGSSQARLRQAMDGDVLVLLDGLIRYWAAR